VGRFERQRGRKRNQSEEDHPDVPMTAMIDVVFLLLVYFVMAMPQRDVIAHLDVYTPSAEAQPREEPADPPSLIRIGVQADGVRFDGVPVSLSRLDQFLGTLSKASTTQSVLITCGSDSRHGSLVMVLNLCARHGLTNLSVTSGL
jgi:biopolymer transport protein ExbD